MAEPETPVTEAPKAAPDAEKVTQIKTSLDMPNFFEEEMSFDANTFEFEEMEFEFGDMNFRDSMNF